MRSWKQPLWAATLQDARLHISLSQSEGNISGILDASEQGPGWAGRTRPGEAAPKGGEEGVWRRYKWNTGPSVEMKVGTETGSSPTVPAPTGWGWGERGRRPHLGLVCTLQRAANESSYCLSPCLHLGFATWALRRPQSWSPSQKGRAAPRSVGSKG